MAGGEEAFPRKSDEVMGETPSAKCQAAVKRPGAGPAKEFATESKLNACL